MRIGLRFARELAARGLLPRVAWIEADLYGSLALTGRGHGTDRAVVMGLMGLDPATVDPHAVAADVEAVRRCGRLPLAGTHAVDFDESHHLHFRVTEQLPEHPNGMRLHAFDAQGQVASAALLYEPPILRSHDLGFEDGVTGADGGVAGERQFVRRREDS